MTPKKKKLKSILRAVGIVAAVSAFILLVLWRCGFFLDRSAVVYSGVCVLWDGREYVPCGGEYTESKTIAKSTNDWTINEIKEDPSHTFIVARSFLDQQLYVDESYEIPNEGRVTKARWGIYYFTNEELLDVFSRIIDEWEKSFFYTTDSIWSLDDDQQMKELYLAYEGCPVTTNLEGFLGYLKGELVFAMPVDSEYPNQGRMECYECWRIPENYSEVLERYTEKVFG